MPRNSLFVDTSGWASYFHAGDPFHAAAVRIYQQAYTRTAAIYTTDHIMAELVALLTSTHYRLSRPRVLAIIATILHDPGVLIEPTGWPLTPSPMGPPATTAPSATPPPTW
ncbi:MAG TPA: PIN domain-containing protein [Chloroflexota bacterium]|nr:PIN domain-containing protein [Chloroflexota bacterium]